MKASKRSMVLLAAFLLTSFPAIATPEMAPGPTNPETPARYSFLDPVGDFFRDSIFDPRTPFEFVPGKNPNDWAFALQPYVWSMGLTGDVGVRRMPAVHVNLSSITVIKHLKWGIFMQGEIRKGRWGVLADGYYASLSASASPRNRIYDNVNLDLQQSIVSLALAYRIIDDRRGYLDVYAGARYNFFGAQFDSSLNTSRINDIGNYTAHSISSLVDSRLDNALDAILVRTSQTGASAADFAASAGIASFGPQDVEKLILKDRELRELTRNGVIVQSLEGSGVSKALASYIRASAAAKASRAAGMADPSLEAAAATEKKKLAKAISKRIEDSIPTSAAENQHWFDPIIGLRGQINFTRWLYLTAQGDVGGFGAGSQIAWNAISAIGINFSRNVYAELGYRYMYLDYQNDNIIYKMNQYGIYSSIGFRF